MSKSKPKTAPPPPANAFPEGAAAEHAISWAIVFAVLVVLAVLLLWAPLARIPRRFDINYNEGWNSYIQQTVVNGGRIYGNPPVLTYTNYPPFSFHVVGLLGKVTGNVTITARCLSAISVFLIALFIGLTVHCITGARRYGAYAGLAFLVFLGIVKPDRIG